MKFKAIFRLESLGIFPTIKEATKVIYDKVMEAIDNDSISFQVLETAVWIEDVERDIPMMFHRLRDNACDEGWIVDGKWVDEQEKTP